MSSKNLHTFLIKLHKELDTNNSVFRKNISNVETHSFVLYKSELLKETIYQLETDKVSYDLVIVEREVNKFFNILSVKFSNMRKSARLSRNIDASHIHVVIKADLKRKASIYNTFGRIKRSAQVDFYKFLTKLYTDSNKSIKLGKGGSFLDITHEGTSQVSIREVKASQLRVKSYLEKYNTISKQELSKLDLDLNIIKNDSRGVVKISIGSSSKNKSKGASLAGIKRQAITKLKSAIGKLGSILELEGVNSIKNQFAEKVLDKVMKPLQVLDRSSSAITVKREKKKSKKTTKSNTKVIKARATRGTSESINSTGYIGPKIKTKTSAVSLKSLIASINLKLVDTVAANMGSPRLNYRTGRFANSVRVTNITKTAKGYPSINYTYMRSPYEVFEYPGSNSHLASVDRDPRALIQKSIREVAVGIINQKFYMRRV